MSNNGSKKGKNAFSDLNVDGMDDKYIGANNSAVRRKRADELLARVKTYEAEVNTLHGAFMKGNRGDAKWEKIAHDISAFCSREARENADVIGIAGDAEKRLEKLRVLSEQMLKEIETFKKHVIIDVVPPDIEKRKIAEAKAKAKAGKGGNSASAFADLSLDGMDKYHARNAEAHKIKRAAELDDRIREFAARKKDAAWIAEADDFCAREELANKDVFSISKESV